VRITRRPPSYEETIPLGWGSGCLTTQHDLFTADEEVEFDGGSVLAAATHQKTLLQEDIMTKLATRQSFPEGQLLVHELTHRINNEIASMIGVVSRAAARSGNRDVEIALTGVAELLHHHADVYRALQMPEYRTRIDAAEYVKQLCLSISRSKLNDMKISMVLAVRPLSMQSDRCWRLGMIVYELVTNAARHAFNGKGGEIRVELLRSGPFVECRVLDNGSAPANIRPGHIRPGHGLKIIEELVEGLDGRFEQQFGAWGSTSTVIIPG
jgi:two-component sensor histidine kinase